MLNQSIEDLYDSDDQTVQTGDIIQGRFLIEDLIGEGSFGQVYKVVDQKQNDQILAMKMEDYSQDSSMLEREIKVLIQMRKKPGFPEIKFYGQERGFIYCIMGLLGRNLENLLKKCGGFFTESTILRIAVQILSRIEALHSQRFIHRDIKPDNFVLGMGNQVNIVHLIDFGLSKYYQNSKGDHIQPSKKAGLIGTARYASVNAHDEQEQSRRDDMESIGYILIYLATGNLPWMNLTVENKELKYAKIHHIKKNISTEELCKNLPKCFLKYMTDVKQLQFQTQPNYQQLKQYFLDEIEQSPSNYLQYDWETLPEYQQKKKHMTVHIMQPTQNKSDEENVPKKEQPLKLSIDIKQGQGSPKRQGTKKDQESPSKKWKRPVMVNVIEAQLDDGNQQIITRGARQNYTYLKPPKEQIQALDVGSLASSRKINYEKHSEDIISEGNTKPIWSLNQQVLGLTSGIKRPTIIRRDVKSHTCNSLFKIISEVQTLKNISQTFVAPQTMLSQGDDLVDDCD